MGKFEIGLIYRKDSVFYLSIEEHRLVTFKKGECIRTYSKENKVDNFEAVRGMTVEDLCQKWKLDINDFDKKLAPFFSPTPEGLKPRSGNKRKARVENDFISQKMRTVKLSMRGVAI